MILTFVICIILILSNSNVYTQSKNIDKTILITDSIGNILGGDGKDWSFNKDHYQNRKIYNYLFRAPTYKDTNYALSGMPASFTYEINDEGVLIKWLTASEKNCKGFFVERAEFNDDYHKLKWASLGYLEGAGNSDKEINYEFLDTEIENFAKYLYRLNQINFNGEHEYYNMDSEVFVKRPNVFEFYPVYPNPVTDTFNISFYLPKKETVSLFFISGTDTVYVLDNEPQERGFYKVTLDKKDVGLKNEIKRLYIVCESCDKKKNFGDVQF